MQSGIAAVFQRYWVALLSRRLQIILIILVIAAVPSPSVASDYLSELEAEADSSASVLDEDAAGSVSTRGGAIGSPRPALSERKEFERVLKVERPHVYTFYSRLPEPRKTQVVEKYLKDSGNIAKTSNLILDLYFKR